jgi:hypothetical protein
MANPVLTDLLGQFCEQVIGVSAKGAGNGDEFNNVDPPFAALVLRHE